MAARRRQRIAAVWAVVLAASILGAGPALAASPASADRSSQVQAVLDRVLGPGASIVEIAATVRTGARSTSSVVWGNATASSTAGYRVRTALGSSAGSSQIDAVDRTTTTVVTPPGALLQQTVTVAVDRRAMTGVPLHRLRRLIASAAGVTPSRGDRLLVVATTFAVPTTSRPSARPWTDALVPLAVPAIEVGGGLVAAVILAIALGGRRRRERVLGRS